MRRALLAWLCVVSLAACQTERQMAIATGVGLGLAAVGTGILVTEPDRAAGEPTTPRERAGALVLAAGCTTLLVVLVSFARAAFSQATPHR